MSSPNRYTKRRSPPNVVPPPSTKSTNGGGFFCKSVLFALFLLAVPLFPSQAPDFVGETVLTKFWELIHLLFVGIAVAYGLFSRRNVESGVDLRMSRVDESSLSYVSRIFQVSSVFDEVFDENSCEFVDLRSESSSINVSTRAFKEREAESFDVETSEYGKTNEVQAWNSQYYQGKSKVVVARPAYGIDGHVVHQSLGLPVRSLRSALRDNVAHEANSFTDSYDGTVYEKADSSLSHENFDEFMAASASPEMMGTGDNYSSDFHPQSVDETEFATLKSTSSRSTASSSSSHASFASHTQNRFSPSHSASEESLNSNVEELVKEKSLQGSSRSSSPSLPPSPALPPSPPSPSLPPSPPSPQLVTDDTYRHSPELLPDDTYRHSPELLPDDTYRHSPELRPDDTHRRAAHSRHYSDGSLLEEDVRKGFEDELEENTVRGRRTTEVFSKKERGSKTLKSTAESSRRANRSRGSYPPESILEGNRSRKSYPPESISSSIGGTDDSTTRRQDLTDDSTTRRRDLLQKSDSYLLEHNIRKGMEGDTNNPRVKKGRSYDSLELTAEDSAKDEKISESFPALDELFQPANAKASRHAMHSSRRGRDTLPQKYVTRNLEDETVDYNKSKKKDIPSNDKEVTSNSPRLQERSWRASSHASLRGKSVRTIRSDRHGKDVKTNGDSSDDRAESKVENQGKTKPRRQRQEELAIVLHQAKASEGRTEVAMEEETEPEAEVEQQPQATFEEEEEAAWESQSNASHDHNEVDRKAGEFIAKFREQIRLQKLKSGEQPRGVGGGTSTIRNSHFR